MEHVKRSRRWRDSSQKALNYEIVIPDLMRDPNLGIPNLDSRFRGNDIREALWQFRNSESERKDDAIFTNLCGVGEAERK